MTTFNKPTVSTNVNGNVFAIIAHVRKALQKSNQHERAEEFAERALNAQSYDEVIQLTFEYIDWEGEEYVTNDSEYENDENDENDENEEDSKPILYREQVDGNAFAIIGAVQKVLNKNKERDKAEEFSQKAYESESYDDLLQLTFQYVDWR